MSEAATPHQDQDQRRPEIVFVPARPLPVGEDTRAALELRELADGTKALPAFTTLAKLVAALGDAQPWVAMPLSAVQEQMRKSQIGPIALDPAIAPGAWRWQRPDLDAYVHDLQQERQRPDPG